MHRYAFLTVIALSFLLSPIAAAGDPPKSDAVTAVEKASRRAGHEFDVLAKKIDDVLWYERVGDVAVASTTTMSKHAGLARLTVRRPRWLRR